MMKIVIDIPKYIYEHAKKQIEDSYDEWVAMRTIANGTPLPKGHGRIADIDKLLEEMRATRTYDIPFALERVKPIIEADKEG